MPGEAGAMNAAIETIINLTMSNNVDISQAMEAVNTLAAGMDTAYRRTNGLDTSLSNLNKTSNQLSIAKQIDQMTRSLSRTMSVSNTLNRALASNSSQIQKLGQDARSATRDINNLQQSMLKRITTSLFDLRTAGDPASALNAQEFSSVLMKSTASRLVGLWAVMRNMRHIHDTVAAMDMFDASLLRITGSAEQTQDALKTAKNVAFAYGASITDVTAVITEFARQGKQMPEIKYLTTAIAETRLLLASSTGELMKMETAAEYMTGIMQQLNLSAMQTVDVMRMMAELDIRTATSFDKIGTAMIRTAASAKVAGLSVQETLAMVTALTEMGFTGETAGTSANTIITRVGRNKAARDFVREQGVELTRMEDGVLKVNSALDILVLTYQKLKAAGNYTDMKDFIEIFGGTRQASRLVGMIEQLIKQQKSYNDMMDDSISATAEKQRELAVSQMMNTIERRKVELKNTMAAPFLEPFFQELYKSSFDGMIAVSKVITSSISMLIRSFADISNLGGLIDVSGAESLLFALSKIISVYMAIKIPTTVGKGLTVISSMLQGFSMSTGQQLDEWAGRKGKEFQLFDVKGVPGQVTQLRKYIEATEKELEGFIAVRERFVAEQKQASQRMQIFEFADDEQLQQIYAGQYHLMPNREALQGVDLTEYYAAISKAMSEGSDDGSLPTGAYASDEQMERVRQLRIEQEKLTYAMSKTGAAHHILVNSGEMTNELYEELQKRLSSYYKEFMDIGDEINKISAESVMPIITGEVSFQIPKEATEELARATLTVKRNILKDLENMKIPIDILVNDQKFRVELDGISDNIKKSMQKAVNELPGMETLQLPDLNKNFDAALARAKQAYDDFNNYIQDSIHAPNIVKVSEQEYMRLRDLSRTATQEAVKANGARIVAMKAQSEGMLNDLSTKLTTLGAEMHKIDRNWHLPRAIRDTAMQMAGQIARLQDHAGLLREALGRIDDKTPGSSEALGTLKVQIANVEAQAVRLQNAMRDVVVKGTQSWSARFTAYSEIFTQWFNRITGFVTKVVMLRMLFQQIRDFIASATSYAKELEQMQLGYEERQREFEDLSKRQEQTTDQANAQTGAIGNEIRDIFSTIATVVNANLSALRPHLPADQLSAVQSIALKGMGFFDQDYKLLLTVMQRIVANNGDISEALKYLSGMNLDEGRKTQLVQAAQNLQPRLEGESDEDYTARIEAGLKEAINLTEQEFQLMMRVIPDLQEIWDSAVNGMGGTVNTVFKEIGEQAEELRKKSEEQSTGDYMSFDNLAGIVAEFKGTRVAAIGNDPKRKAEAESMLDAVTVLGEKISKISDKTTQSAAQAYLSATPGSEVSNIARTQLVTDSEGRNILAEIQNFQDDYRNNPLYDSVLNNIQSTNAEGIAQVAKYWQAMLTLSTKNEVELVKQIQEHKTDLIQTMKETGLFKEKPEQSFLSRWGIPIGAGALTLGGIGIATAGAPVAGPIAAILAVIKALGSIKALAAAMTVGLAAKAGTDVLTDSAVSSPNSLLGRIGKLFGRGGEIGSTKEVAENVDGTAKAIEEYGKRLEEELNQINESIINPTGISEESKKGETELESYQAVKNRLDANLTAQQQNKAEGLDVDKNLTNAVIKQSKNFIADLTAEIEKENLKRMGVDVEGYTSRFTGEPGEKLFKELKNILEVINRAILGNQNLIKPVNLEDQLSLIKNELATVREGLKQEYMMKVDPATGLATDLVDRTKSVEYYLRAIAENQAAIAAYAPLMNNAERKDPTRASTGAAKEVAKLTTEIQEMKFRLEMIAQNSKKIVMQMKLDSAKEQRSWIEGSMFSGEKQQAFIDDFTTQADIILADYLNVKTEDQSAYKSFIQGIASYIGEMDALVRSGGLSAEEETMRIRKAIVAVNNELLKYRDSDDEGAKAGLNALRDALRARQDVANKEWIDFETMTLELRLSNIDRQLLRRYDMWALGREMNRWGGYEGDNVEKVSDHIVREVDAIWAAGLDELERARKEGRPIEPILKAIQEKMGQANDWLELLQEHPENIRGDSSDGMLPPTMEDVWNFEQGRGTQYIDTVSRFLPGILQRLEDYKKLQDDIDAGEEVKINLMKDPVPLPLPVRVVNLEEQKTPEIDIPSPAGKDILQSGSLKDILGKITEGVKTSEGAHSLPKAKFEDPIAKLKKLEEEVSSSNIPSSPVILSPDFWKQTNMNENQVAIIKQILPAVFESAGKHNLFPSVILGQMILESGFGTSDIAKNANNIFGIKKRGTGGVPGKDYYQSVEGGSKWEIHDSWMDSVLKHGLFLDPYYGGKGTSRYDYARKASTPEEQIKRIEAANYAGNERDYDENVLSRMAQFNLKLFDELFKSSREISYQVPAPQTEKVVAVEQEAIQQGVQQVTISKELVAALQALTAIMGDTLVDVLMKPIKPIEPKPVSVEVPSGPFDILKGHLNSIWNTLKLAPERAKTFTWGEAVKSIQDLYKPKPEEEKSEKKPFFQLRPVDPKLLPELYTKDTMLGFDALLPRLLPVLRPFQEELMKMAESVSKSQDEQRMAITSALKTITNSDRVKQMVKDNVWPTGRNMVYIYGYDDVLDAKEGAFRHLPFRPGDYKDKDMKGNIVLMQATDATASSAGEVVIEEETLSDMGIYAENTLPVFVTNFPKSLGGTPGFPSSYEEEKKEEEKKEAPIQEAPFNPWSETEPWIIPNPQYTPNWENPPVPNPLNPPIGPEYPPQKYMPYWWGNGQLPETLAEFLKRYGKATTDEERAAILSGKVKELEDRAADPDTPLDEKARILAELEFLRKILAGVGEAMAKASDQMLVTLKDWYNMGADIGMDLGFTEEGWTELKKQIMKRIAMSIRKVLDETLVEALNKGIADIWKNSGIGKSISETFQKLFGEKFGKIFGDMFGDIIGGIFSSVVGFLIGGLLNSIFGLSDAAEQMAESQRQTQQDRVTASGYNWSYREAEKSTPYYEYSPPITQESVKIVKFQSTFNITTDAARAMMSNRRELERVCEEILTQWNRNAAKTVGARV